MPPFSAAAGPERSRQEATKMATDIAKKQPKTARKCGMRGIYTRDPQKKLASYVLLAKMLARF